MKPMLLVLLPIATAGLMGWASGAAAQAPEAPQVLRFELSQQLPWFTAQVDGRPARLLLDLGGGASLALRPDWAAGEAQGGPSAPAAASANAPVLLPGATVPQSLPRRTWNKAQRPLGLDGYLGWGYLSGFSVVVDYAQQQVRLHPPGRLADECTAPAAPLAMLGSLPYGRFESPDGRSWDLGLDTGANQNVHRADGPAPSLPLQLAGRTLDTGAFRAIPLNLPVVAGFLGHDFFARNRVCLDASSRRWSAQPHSP